MVRATIILETEYFLEEEIRIVCPFCDSLVELHALSYGDYVDQNWLYYCCGTYLMCKFLEVEPGEPIDECTIQMSSEEVQAACKKYNLEYKEGESRGLKVAVLKLKFVLPSDQIPDDVDDVCEDVRSAYTAKSAARGCHLTGECFSLYEAEKQGHVDLRHDGCNVGYVGECSECGEEYVSHFWGD